MPKNRCSFVVGAEKRRGGKRWRMEKGRLMEREKEEKEVVLEVRAIQDKEGQRGRQSKGSRAEQKADVVLGSSCCCDQLP